MYDKNKVNPFESELPVHATEQHPGEAAAAAVYTQAQVGHEPMPNQPYQTVVLKTAPKYGRLLLAGGVTVGALMFGVHSCDVQNAHVDGGPGAKVDGQVLHDTLTTTRQKLVCSDSATELTAEHGEQHYNGFGLNSTGAQKVDKLYQGAFNYCAANTGLLATLTKVTAPDGTVVSASETLPDVQVVGPSIDFLAPINCVALRVKDANNLKKIQQKIDERNAAVKKAVLADPDAPKIPDCDSGVHEVPMQLSLFGLAHISTGISVSPKDGEAQAAGMTAELGLALDPDRTDQEIQVQQHLIADETTYLQGEYPKAKVTVLPPAHLASTEEILQKRFAYVVQQHPGIGSEFSTIVFTVDKHGVPTMTAKGGDGETINVAMPDDHMSAQEVDMLNADIQGLLNANRTIPNITESPSPTPSHS